MKRLVLEGPDGKRTAIVERAALLRGWAVLNVHRLANEAWLKGGDNAPHEDAFVKAFADAWAAVADAVAFVGPLASFNAPMKRRLGMVWPAHVAAPRVPVYVVEGENGGDWRPITWPEVRAVLGAKPGEPPPAATGLATKGEHLEAASALRPDAIGTRVFDPRMWVSINGKRIGWVESFHSTPSPSVEVIPELTADDVRYFARVEMARDPDAWFAARAERAALENLPAEAVRDLASKLEAGDPNAPSPADGWRPENMDPVLGGPTDPMPELDDPADPLGITRRGW